MEDEKNIYIKGKKLTPNAQCVVRLTQEAFEALIEVVNESNMSIKYVASEIILQAINKNLIRYDRKEEE